MMPSPRHTHASSIWWPPSELFRQSHDQSVAGGAATAGGAAMAAAAAGAGQGEGAHGEATRRTASSGGATLNGGGPCNPSTNLDNYVS